MQTENLLRFLPVDAQGIANAMKQSRAFAETFFKHHCRYAFSKMHLESFTRYDASITADLFSREGTRTAIAAPRGAAKSTLHSFMLPLMDICFSRERYILLISATIQQAVQRLQGIKAEILSNEKLRHAFPHLAGREVWQRKSIVVGGVQIDAFGALSEIRGIASRGVRPTKIILDDCESSLRVRQKEHRDATLAWYDQVIENLGDNFTNIEIVGTMLHPVSLLATLLKRPGFISAFYQGIISESRAAGLWKKYVDIYNNSLEQNSPQLARAFYKENKPEMDEDVEVLWPQKESYERLVQLRARIGDDAFAKEKQNAPRDDDHRLFNTSDWRYFNVDTKRKCVVLEPHPSVHHDELDYKLADMQFYGYLDSAVANNSSSRKSDYAAIVVIGRMPRDLLFVVDAVIKRIGSDQQVCEIFRLNDQYRFTRFGFESNGFQALVGESIVKHSDQRRKKNMHWHVPLQPVQNNTNKKVRIELLNEVKGRIFFSRSLPKILFEQADEFPQGRFDDGLDALAGAVALTKVIPVDIRTFERQDG